MHQTRLLPNNSVSARLFFSSTDPRESPRRRRHLR